MRKPKRAEDDQPRDARRRILDAAVAILRDEGVRALTQTRTATRAGVRQSHLTYYFPKKSDLLAAALRERHRLAEAAADASPEGDPFDAAMHGLATLMFDSDHMRSFLALVVEAGDAEETRAIMADHARGLSAALAPLFGRKANDADVVAFIDMLRGMGLRRLLETKPATASVNITRIAARFGLKRATPKKAAARNGASRPRT
jgi:AcrR family transcriptional regulator